MSSNGDNMEENQARECGTLNNGDQQSVRNDGDKQTVENYRDKQTVENDGDRQTVRNDGDRQTVENDGDQTVKKRTSQDEEESANESSQDEEEDYTSELQTLLAKLGIRKKGKKEKVLNELTLKGIANFILSEKCNNVIVLTGAGISTSAGIPDFRSPGSGLYAQLEKYDLPNPQSIFEIAYFKSNPKPFFTLAKELYPGNFQPTPSHHFIRLLEKKGLLLRNYTQNIDGLELVADLPDEKLVAAHGTFHASHCIECRKYHTEEFVKKAIFSDSIPYCDDCSGLVKPDIVFFGENLPEIFFTCVQTDFLTADLLIIMGTSLKVQPFASLVDEVKDDVPRLLINREKCGQEMLFGGLDFDSEYNYRDVAVLGDCDGSCFQLAEALGWKILPKTTQVFTIIINVTMEPPYKMLILCFVIASTSFAFTLRRFENSNCVIDNEGYTRYITDSGFMRCPERICAMEDYKSCKLCCKETPKVHHVTRRKELTSTKSFDEESKTRSGIKTGVVVLFLCILFIIIIYICIIYITKMKVENSDNRSG